MFANEYSSRKSKSNTFKRQSARRTGQALLLAVLVLLFAALLGTAFIAVVAINIGQTARQEERDKAKQAAQAGLDFANRQLTFSETALNWRPESEVQDGVFYRPPTSSDVTYWTPFDQAQGWASNTNTDPATGQPSGNYVKFPDPRSVNQNLSAPNYMVKVERVLANDPIGDNTNGDKTGALRVSVVGLSSDDPNSFQKIVAYKAGTAQMPGTSAMRTITNWDFQNGVVPSAQVASYTAGTPASLVVGSSKGQFPSAPFYITVGGINTTTGTNTPIFTQVVQAVAVDTPAVGQATLTLPTNLNPTTSGVPIAGDRVEVAAALGAPNGIDFNNDGSVTTSSPTEFSATQPFFNVSTTTTPGSVWTNGGLVWFGNSAAKNLNSPQNGSAPGLIRASGLMSCYNSSAPSFNTSISVTGKDSSNTTFTGTLATDSLTSFPGSFTGGQAAQVIEDGLNRLNNNSTDTTRQVQPFTPPDLAAGGDGLGRYRQLTKYSVSTDSANPQGAAYGYGEGIYLNNPQDKERIGVAGGSYREMTQAELHAMWFSDKNSGIGAYYRRATPALNTAADKSLEEQHLRGWVAPAEFCPRGAYVQLNDDGTITITLDARADGYSASGISPNAGPSPFKAWHNTDGTLMGDSTYGGVYTRATIPWPTNGVLFAEGNIRIGGKATSAPRSLTVVSMNNIYIEDSLSAGVTHKVMLLAAKNVVVNPTRVLAMPDSQTLLSAPTTNGDTTIRVQDASSFQVGDWVKIDTGSTTDSIGAIKGISINPDQLTLSTPVTAQAVSSVVRVITDPVNSSGVPFTDYDTRLSRFDNVLQRRVNLPAGTALRLDIRHSAERVSPLTVTTVQGTGLGKTLTKAQLFNKAVDATDPRTTLIHSAEKFLRVDYDDSGGAGQQDKFYNAAPFADEPTARNYQIGDTTDSTLTDRDNLKEDMEAENTSPDWHYTATLQNSYGDPTKVTTLPPAHFLSGVGNRYPYGVNATPWSKDIFFGTNYEIPLATSIITTVDGIQSAITNDRVNPSTSSLEQVKQFGFGFLFGSNTTPASPDEPEDVLTADRTFYNNGYNGAPGAGDNTYYALDSRTFDSTHAGQNTIAFKFNPAAEGYFDTTPPNGTTHMPFYRVSRLKLENSTFQYDNTTKETNLKSLNPAYIFDINAYIYAQQGSWYVIPGDYFDASSRTDTTASGAPLDTPSDVRLNYVNLPHNTSSAKQSDEDLDLDRDGVVSPTEQAATYRYHRNNYQINFTGAIMENQTAAVIDAGTGAALTQVTGDVQNWMDKWATTRLAATDFSSGTVNHTGLTIGTNFSTMQYSFDPAAMQGALDTDTGFRPPISSEWLYQSG